MITAGAVHTHLLTSGINYLQNNTSGVSLLEFSNSLQQYLIVSLISGSACSNNLQPYGAGKGDGGGTLQNQVSLCQEIEEKSRRFSKHRAPSRGYSVNCNTRKPVAATWPRGQADEL